VSTLLVYVLQSGTLRAVLSCVCEGASLCFDGREFPLPLREVSVVSVAPADVGRVSFAAHVQQALTPLARGGGVRGVPVGARDVRERRPGYVRVQDALVVQLARGAAHGTVNTVELAPPAAVVVPHADSTSRVLELTAAVVFRGLRDGAGHYVAY